MVKQAMMQIKIRKMSQRKRKKRRKNQKSAVNTSLEEKKLTMDSWMD